MDMPRVLLYEKIDERAVDYLRQHATVVYASALDESSLIRQVADVEGIIIRANGAVTRRIIEAAPRLKVIGRHGVGVEAIDIEAASERGIYVVNTPDANTEAVAEHVIGMLITLAKRMGEADRALRAGRWHVRYEYVGQELRGRTLGVVGIGRIGYRVAEICHSMGMRILYHDVVRSQVAEVHLDAYWVALPDLLRQADAVSLHVPLLPNTHHLIGASELALMKPTAILINTARGGVVDNRALVDALQSGRIAGAGIDVFEQEPLPPGSPFCSLENVVITPHMAAHTHEALYHMAMVVEDIVRVLQGLDPKFPVNNPRRNV